MTTTTFLVTGMTCQHCINAVTTEISGVPAVTSVRVDLESGNVTVESDGVLEAEPILEAIVAAGYSGQAV
ncbi:MAG: copper chaperone CopZ [Alpinimonas sp.]|jgi:copper chaperone